MTAPAASPQTSHRAPWALWTTLLAMLLAVQASAGAIRAAALVDSATVAAKLALPAPLAAQFRDTSPALKAAGQRLSPARLHDGHDGAAPPLPAIGAPLPVPVSAARPSFADFGATPHHTARSGANRARAPPLAA